MAKKTDIETKIQKIVEGIQERKGKRIVTINLTHLNDAPCSYFVVCQGDSNTHVNAIALSVKDYVREKIKEKPSIIDGLDSCQWVAMDYGDTIVHVFQRPEREFYDLESLWLNAEVKYFEDIL
ncbi:MAG: ribosome silencing factor [Prevotellaceae bacterium]|jgi:ribosome-associated protein|nr:ribosome silencing factor [Prevotellaceae bacterium]